MGLLGMARGRGRMIGFVVMAVIGFLAVATQADASATSYQQAVLNDNPSVFYELNDPNCCQATDSSSSGADGSYAQTGVAYSLSGAMGDAQDASIQTDGSTAPVEA